MHKPTNDHGLVFFSPHSKSKVLSNNSSNKLLEIILKELNMERISVHGLRHTHASLLLYRKVSIFFISERLGHADIDTTLRHYAHVIKELRIEDTKNTINTFEEMALV